MVSPCSSRCPHFLPASSRNFRRSWLSVLFVESLAHAARKVPFATVTFSSVGCQCAGNLGSVNATGAAPERAPSVLGSPDTAARSHPLMSGVHFKIAEVHDLGGAGLSFFSGRKSPPQHGRTDHATHRLPIRFFHPNLSSTKKIGALNWPKILLPWRRRQGQLILRGAIWHSFRPGRSRFNGNTPNATHAIQKSSNLAADGFLPIPLARPHRSKVRRAQRYAPGLPLCLLSYEVSPHSWWRRRNPENRLSFLLAATLVCTAALRLTPNRVRSSGRRCISRS